MVVNTISEAKAHLSALVERALAGEEVIIGRAGKPVVRLTPCGAERVPKFGSMRGLIRIADDFDDLPPELAEAFGLTEP
jgi:prevent-host-death family protein